MKDFPECTNLHGLHIEVTKLTIVRFCRVFVYPLLARIYLSHYLTFWFNSISSQLWISRQNWRNIAWEVHVQVLLILWFHTDFWSVLNCLCRGWIRRSASGGWFKFWHCELSSKTDTMKGFFINFFTSMQPMQTSMNKPSSASFRVPVVTRWPRRHVKHSYNVPRAVAIAHKLKFNTTEHFTGLTGSPPSRKFSAIFHFPAHERLFLDLSWFVNIKMFIEKAKTKLTFNNF